MTKTAEEVFDKLLTPEQRKRAAENGAKLVEEHAKELSRARQAPCKVRDAVRPEDDFPHS